MRLKYLFIFTLLISANWCMGQDDGSFTVQVSSDSVLMGNTLTLKYSLENMEGEFIAPDLSDFRVVSGPNVSSQFSSINGRVSQKSSYTYYLIPLSQGIASIGGAKVGFDNDWVQIDPIEIIVLDNPHGIEDNYGNPLSIRRGQMNRDTLTPKQKSLLEKLKKGKRRKI